MDLQKNDVDFIRIPNTMHKPIINVFVILGPGLLTKKANGSNYTGMLYDIWKQIKMNLEPKYQIVEVFDKIKSYDECIDWIVQGKYDIIIGPFQYTHERMKSIDFTSTLVLSKDSILGFPKRSFFSFMYTVLRKVFIKPFTLLFTVGLISGFILFRIEPKRFGYLKKKSFSLRRAIVTTTASLFGEAGYLFENTTLSFSGMIVMFLIMIVAFFFSAYIQAITTDRVIHLQNTSSINRENIHLVTLLSPKGYSVGKNLERLGAKIEYVDKNVEDTIEYYKQNKDKYGGVALDYMDAKSREEPNIDLKVNKGDFGFKEIAFIITKNKPRLRQDINQEIVTLQDNLQTEKICRSYLDGEDAFLCVM